MIRIVRRRLKHGSQTYIETKVRLINKFIEKSKINIFVTHTFYHSFFSVYIRFNFSQMYSPAKTGGNLASPMLVLKFPLHTLSEGSTTVP